jgi:hypothetical protein
MVATNYIQLPPDGVGKAVRHRKITDIVTGTITGTTPAVGANIVGASSGSFGTLTGIYSSSTINYFLENVVGTFTISENLYLSGSPGTIYATVANVSYNVYEPSVSISDAKIPEYSMTIAKASGGRGAAVVQFPEFAPQFDAYGHMQVTQMQAAGEYYFYNNDLSGKFSDFKAGSGTVTYEPYTSSMLMTTTANPGGSIGNGDLARRTTAQYHPFKQGVGHLILTSVQVGDTGVANVVREWGYFDDNNGFGFRLDGTTLKVFLRNDAKGYPIDWEIPQSQWNVNTLLTDATSDMIGYSGPKALDVSKTNYYWMDMQSESGRIRLGVIAPDGTRIICHQYLTTNAYPSATVQSGLVFGGNGAVATTAITWPTACRQLNLPLTWTQRNKSNVTNTGNPYMRYMNGVVFHETADIKYYGVYTHITPPNPVVVQSSDDYQPFLSFKAKTLTENGLQNSTVGIHETFDFASFGNVGLHIGIFVAPSEDYLVGTQWSRTIDPDTMLYVDQSAYAMPQYQFWGTTASVTASMAPSTGLGRTVIGAGGNGLANGTTIYWDGNPSQVASNLTVTAINTSGGNLLVDMYLGTNQWQYNTPWTSGSVSNKTRVVAQLVAAAGWTNVACSGNAISSQGGATGQRYFTISSASNVYPGQIVSGTGVPIGTYVSQVNGTNITITNTFTTGNTGTYSFANVGGVGTYLTINRANIAQTISSTTMYGWYRFQPIESFIAPANSQWRDSLGDRLDKSFGLGSAGPSGIVPEQAKGVFIFGVKAIGPFPASTPPSLTYTKFWKEIR